MPKADFLGEFEQIILLAVLRLAGNAYGMEVRRELESRIGRDSSIGAVYATLDRLETKGLLHSHEIVDGPRPRRLYKVTAQGEQALQVSRQALTRMWQGLKVNP
jgi:PadR family transcriptional regulator, regulatory protein PadR